MAQNNPYEFSPDIDADLFDTPTQGNSEGHTLGGTCAQCGQSHDLADLPNEIANALRRLLPDEMGGGFPTDPSNEVKMLHGFLNLLTRLDNTDPSGPVTAALAHPRQQADRALLIDLYIVERSLLASHLALKSANGYLEGLHSIDEPNDDTRLQIVLMGLCCDFMLLRIEQLGQLYDRFAPTLEADMDRELVATGVYSTPSVVRDRVLLAPLQAVMT